MKTLLLVTVAAVLGTSLVAAMLHGFNFSHATVISADAHSCNVAQLTVPDSAHDDLYGYSVAIDGDLALIGAPQNDRAGVNSGAVYAFQKGHSAVQVGSDDSEEFSEFGRSVAINGQVALVGKPGDSALGEDAGAACIYRRDDRNHWRHVQRLVAADGAAKERFGESVAMVDGIVMIGSYGIHRSGAVYVFQEDKYGTWQQRTKLDPSGTTSEDRFGCHVAIDGSLTVVGASGANDNSGAVYLFERNGLGDWLNPIKLNPPDGKMNCFFGEAVAVWDRTVVIGAPGIGSVFVFREKVPGNWQQVAKLVADDATSPSGFGRAVGVNANGVVVGAPHRSDPDGAIYVFKADSDGIWRQTSRIAALAPPSRSWFGSALATSGNAVLVGARYGKGRKPSSGAAYLIEPKDDQR